MLLQSSVRQPFGYLFSRLCRDAVPPEETADIHIPGSVDGAIKRKGSKSGPGCQQKLLVPEGDIEVETRNFVRIIVQSVGSQEFPDELLGKHENELEGKGSVLAPDQGKTVLSQLAPGCKCPVMKNVYAIGVIEIPLPGPVYGKGAEGRDRSLGEIPAVKCI